MNDMAAVRESGYAKRGTTKIGASQRETRFVQDVINKFVGPR